MPTLEPPTAVAGEYRNELVVLMWTAPADTSGLEGYTVFRDGNLVGSTLAGITRFVDRELPDLTPGTSYRYQVRSDGPAGGNPADSALSAAIQVTVPAENDPD